MPGPGNPLGTSMRAAVGLTGVFLIAVAVALAITVSSVSTPVRVLALASVTPVIILGLVIIVYCRKRSRWGFAGASILGAVGVCLRVVVSTQPSLEVGGGLPTGVTVLYIVLGALVSLKNYEAFLELRDLRP